MTTTHRVSMDYLEAIAFETQHAMIRRGDVWTRQGRPLHLRGVRMTTDILPAPEGLLRVTCDLTCSRPIDCTVQSATHATNLAAKHEKTFHAAQDSESELMALETLLSDQLERRHGPLSIAHAILAAGYVKAPF